MALITSMTRLGAGAAVLLTYDDEAMQLVSIEIKNATKRRVRVWCEGDKRWDYHTRDNKDEKVSLSRDDRVSWEYVSAVDADSKAERQEIRPQGVSIWCTFGD